MIRLAHVMETFEADFLAEYADRLNANQRRALAAMQICRSQAAQRMQVRCEDCAHKIFVPHSCGHRHCPHCQAHESQRWLEKQLQRQVPASYFLITFTLPAEFRTLAFSHQEAVYGLLLQSAWQTVLAFSRNDRQLQGTPGAIAVLHTHSRRLDYHPHVHLLMPAAALDQHKRWRTKRTGPKKRYLFNHKALAKVFRAKMLAGIEAAGLVLPSRHPGVWVVDCKAVGGGDKALVYLGRYLYRGVIREEDILSSERGPEGGRVSFRYRDARTSKMERRTVTGAHFLWLVLQHVLPRRFQRARNFGFLHSNSKRLIALLHLVLKFVPAQVALSPRPAMACPCCGAAMAVVRTRLPSALASANAPPLARREAAPIM